MNIRRFLLAPVILGAMTLSAGCQVAARHADGADDPIASTDPVWDQLAECESGGDWSINTGNGYSGGLQFAASTWSGLGGTGLAHEHSREEQIRLATILRDQSGGYGAWPSCAAQLGLPT